MRIRLACLAVVMLLPYSGHAADVHVRPDGKDAHPGSSEKPLQTLGAAQRAVRAARAAGSPVTVHLHGGVYYLPETLVLTAEDSGTAQTPVIWQAAGDGEVVISGGIKLGLQWESFRNGIWQAQVPAGVVIEQLFVDGTRQVLARFPNFDPAAKIFNGVAADCVSPERAKRWHDPAGGFLHAMHAGHWGGFSYRITGKDENGQVKMEGGWQGNRASDPHANDRYVENVFEELDAPGEWFFQPQTRTLYYYPPAGIDLQTAVLEAARLRNLLQFTGTEQTPVRFVTFRGMTFRHTVRTFMETREPLLRSDWTICRAGAVLFDGAENCALEDAFLDQVGGNAVFVNNYNRRIAVRGCRIDRAGANGVMFVGDPQAVRNPLFEYGQRQNRSQLDMTPGPRTGNYPADCLVEDCLITMIGRVEKQATGVGMDMAARVTVRHCSIYDVPRAGINIGDGCWGGHLVEFCDVFNTVLETGDHGSFNSWGRDRFWMLGEAPDEELPALALLDVVEPIILRDSRWRCDHGWDIDLDDGSSNYHIYNNLCLNGGIKNREGFHRTVENNIIVNNGFHPHVWYPNSGDIFRRNILFAAHQPAIMPESKWGQEVDYNLYASSAGDRAKFAAQGCDAHSLVGDPKFEAPDQGDLRVQEDSPARQLGFQNFSMDQFGVQKPSLKAIAKTPEMPEIVVHANTSDEATKLPRIWQGATVRNLAGEEYSAFGVSRESGGVPLAIIPAGSLLDRQGFRAGDLVQAVNGRAVRDVDELFGNMQEAGGKPVKVRCVRAQQSQEIELQDYVMLRVESSSQSALAAVSGTITRVKVAASKSTANEPLHTLCDGKCAADYGPVFPNGVTDGMHKLDLGSLTDIAEIRTASFNQNGNRGSQHFVIYGSELEKNPDWDVSDAARFVPLAEVSVEATDRFLVTSLRRAAGGSLGQYRWLVWAVVPVTAAAENTAFQELQVIGTGP